MLTVTEYSNDSSAVRFNFLRQSTRRERSNVNEFIARGKLCEREIRVMYHRFLSATGDSRGFSAHLYFDQFPSPRESRAAALFAQ